MTLPLFSQESTSNALKACLEAERVPISVQGVRERVLATTRIGGGAAADSDKGRRLRISWLLGQLKIGLRPVWAAAVEAIAVISERDGDSVWSSILEQLSSLEQTAQAIVSPSWATDDEEQVDEVNESEKMWRDPSAHKARLTIASWSSYSSCVRQIISVCWFSHPSIVLISHLSQSQKYNGRYDAAAYEVQLLQTLGKITSVAEKHSRDLVPRLLSLVDRDHLDKAMRVKLRSWLKLFSDFTNPKALYRSDDIRQLYVSMLSHPDKELQILALSCMQTFKDPILSRRADTLRLLLDETRWRDEVTKLDIHAFTNDEREAIIPVLIRIFYGLIRERGSFGKGANRKSALLGLLCSCTESELQVLVDLMTGGFPAESTVNEDGLWKVDEAVSTVPKKQQIGFLTLLEDVLKVLGSRLGESVVRLFRFTVSFTGLAQQELQHSVPEEAEDVENNEGMDKENEESDSPSILRQTRLTRQLGVKRLTQFFRLPTDHSFSSYMPEVYRTVITPRLELFDRENTQAPSGLLELFDSWTMHPDKVMYLVHYDDRTLAKIYDCLVATNVKAGVLMKIFDMIERILAFSEEDESMTEALIRPYMPGLLANLSTCIQAVTRNGASSPIDLLAQREIALLSRLSPHVSDTEQAKTMLTLFLGQLRKSGRKISEKSRADMLVILRNLFPRIPDLSDRSNELHNRTFETVSSLFQTLRTRQARLALVDTFRELSKLAAESGQISEDIASLNAYSTTRLDQPDFDRRLAAFANINERRWLAMTADEWKPVLYNALFFIQDEDELSIRSNAALSMRRFLDRLASDLDAELFQPCFSHILFPGLKLNLRSRYDPVRSEVLGVISYAVDKCGDIAALSELRMLLAGGDEEANFFNNVCHVQVHRRIRALHRLSDFCDEPGFRNTTLRELFIPIVSRFIADGVDHHLVSEAIQTLGRIARHLTWSTYFWLVQQNIKVATGKSGSERIASRTIVSILDHFHFSLADSFVADKVHEDASEDEAEEDGISRKVSDGGLPVSTKILDAVTNRLLPTLFKHLESRHGLEDVNRIPLAAGIGKICVRLPSDIRDSHVSRLLTIVAQIFRSKSQETRDVARDTLCRILVTLGPSYLGLAVRQLREALLRGPHLHISATVTHALLVHVTSGSRISTFNVLDDCVADSVHVAAEVIFGQSGRDVESEGFKTKSKEVRSSKNKGLDTFGLLSQHITPTAMGALLAPIKAILHETASIKILQSVDEALRRIATGLNTNSHFGQTDILLLSHTLITQNAQFFANHKRPAKKPKSKVVTDVTVQLKRKKDSEESHFAHNGWRSVSYSICRDGELTANFPPFSFVSFGLDLFTTMYRRGRFSLQDPDILSRLEPFVNVIGNTLYSSNGDVVAAGLKATTQMAKCPLKNLEKSLPIFVRQALEIVRLGGSTESELSQAALKTLTVIIRDCSTLQLKEKDLGFLIELISPDLEEADRQATAFPLLRAVVWRKFVVPEIYDLMDRVREIMITSQSPQVQELCRSVFLQFLLDYPQGKGRLKQQFTFLARNLTYIYESGRRSVMELLRAIITKFNDDIIEEYSDMLFVPLVLVVAQDDSTKCREIAGQLVKLLITRLGAEQRRAKVSYVQSWASAVDKVALAKVSSQVYGFMIDCIKDDMEQFLPMMLDDLKHKIQDAASGVEGDEEEADIFVEDGAWQVPYHALTTLSKVCQAFPSTVQDHSKLPWNQILTLLLYPHDWVRAAACRLLGILYASRPVAAPEPDATSVEVDQAVPSFSFQRLRETADALTLQLKGEHLDDALSLQIVKNLFYIGKCFYAADNNEQTIEAGLREADAGDASQSEEEDAVNEGQGGNNPLPWLFSRLSYQARSAHIARQKSSKQVSGRFTNIPYPCSTLTFSSRKTGPSKSKPSSSGSQLWHRTWTVPGLSDIWCTSSLPSIVSWMRQRYANPTLVRIISLRYSPLL